MHRPVRLSVAAYLCALHAATLVGPPLLPHRRRQCVRQQCNDGVGDSHQRSERRNEQYKKDRLVLCVERVSSQSSQLHASLGKTAVELSEQEEPHSLSETASGVF